MANFGDKRVLGFVQWLKENQVNVTRHDLEEFLVRRIIESATPAQINDKREYYREIYLKSEHWKTLRKRKLKIISKCEVCGNRNNLDVHHRHYRNLYDVELEDLSVLCRVCHERLHAAVDRMGVTGERKTQALDYKLNKMLPSYKLEKLRGRLFRMARIVKKTHGIDLESLLRPTDGGWVII